MRERSTTPSLKPHLLPSGTIYLTNALLAEHEQSQTTQIPQYRKYVDHLVKEKLYAVYLDVPGFCGACF